MKLPSESDFRNPTASNWPTSLSEEIFCSWKCQKYPEEVRDVKIEHKRRKAQDPLSTSYFSYQYFISEIAKELLTDYQTLSCSDALHAKIRSFDFKILNSSYSGFCYKIKKEGITVGYLLATIHAAPKNLARFDPKTIQAILKAKKIAYEIHLDGPSQLSFNENLQQAMEDPLFHSGVRILSSVFEKMKISEKYGTEYRVAQLAKKTSAHEMSLESPEQHLHSLKEILKLPICADESKQIEIQKKCINSFEIADVPGILQASYEFFSGSVASQKQLVTDRNIHMTNKAEAILLQNPTTRSLFAVGMTHVVGEEGVTELLQQRGYELCPISPSTSNEVALMT